MSKFDRDSSGKFLPGHRVKSPGRPEKAKEHEYYTALSKAVTPETIEAIGNQIKEYILAGNYDARLIKLLFDKLVPNMPRRIQVEDERVWENLAYLIEQLQQRDIPLEPFFRQLADGLDQTNDRNRLQ